MEMHPHKFDDFLKETLKGHQLVPSEKARKAFLAEASGIIPATKGWLKWYYWPLLVIFISGIIAFFYFRNNNEDASVIPAITDDLSQASLQDSSNLGIDKNTTSTSTSTSTSTFNAKSSAENEPVTARSSVPVFTQTTSENNSTFVTAELGTTGDAAVSVPEVTVAESSQYAVNVESRTTIQDTLVQASVVVAAEESSATEKESKDAPGSGKADLTPYFTAGVYYLPEWMFNTIEDNKFVNNFGFEATFYRGPISIRTGAGLSVSKGITKNSVAYNDYLGVYNKLDSITFIFNEEDHDFLPNLFMSSQKVWDSIQKFDSADVIKRYTYLQVPLVLGFDFWQKERLTIGVRVGTIMSLLLNSKQLTGEYDPGENMVLGINTLTPGQVSINWQAIGGINASARLTGELYLEIEPQAKYYYQSIYEKSDFDKKPWSLGLRMAMVYKF